MLARFPDRTQYVEELGDALADSANLNSELGKIDETKRLLKQTVAILEESVVRHPGDQELLVRLAMALRMLAGATYRTDPGPAEKYLIRSRDLSRGLAAKSTRPGVFVWDLLAAKKRSLICILTVSDCRRPTRPSNPPSVSLRSC